jgi:hypothetical protein
MLSAWQTIALSLVVALVTTLVAPYVLRWAEWQREKKVARRLVATEILRLRTVVAFGVANAGIIEGGWSERVKLDPPLPAWQGHKEVLAAALSGEAFRRVSLVYDEWDLAYIVFGQPRNSPLTRSLDTLVEKADAALADLGRG